MKTLPYFLLLLTSFAFVACEQADPEADAAYQKLLEENQKQMAISAEKDSTVNAMMSTFNDIYANLKQIREKEGGLKVGNADLELQASTDEQIINELKSIDELMDANRQKIAALRSQLSGNNVAMDEMALAIDNLNGIVEERDQEIMLLEEELTSTNSTLGTLIEMYRDQSQMVETQQDELNTAYYIFGTSKELKEQGILTKEGGFAGIGGKQRLSGDIDLSQFKKVDITKDTVIALKVKDATILSTHPSGSYEMIGEGNQLNITDPEKFWSLSKYLVISVSQ